MIKLLHREDCCGCGACAATCPHGAIRMEADGMGFRYPVVDRTLCVDCGLCEKTCAFKLAHTPAVARAEVLRFPALLENSQSGGLATAVMNKALKAGYIVYGAAQEADFRVRHRRVDSPEGLEPLRLSKYAQSDMEGIPQQVLQDLKAGRKVLFTGTPCQCAGIGSLCEKYRDHLLLADILCHGVPAPAVWKSYVEWEEKRKGKKLTAALSRDPAWPGNVLHTRLEFGPEKVLTRDYMFLFLKNLILRPSCFQCPFSSLHRPSDITMADAWGVEKVLPGFADDGKGCSMLLCATEAGTAFTTSFADACVRQPVPLEKMMQAPLERPARKHLFADSFEKTYLRSGFRRAQARFGAQSVPGVIERWIPRLNPFNTKLYRRLKKKLSCE